MVDIARKENGIVEEKVIYYANFMEEVFQRTMKKSEVEHIKKWVEMKIPLHEIVRAYGLMMRKCEKPAFAYMAKIIENWH